MTKPDDAEISLALREAGASYLGPEGASYLKRRLSFGSCFDSEHERFNLGALRNLQFGYAERKALSLGEVPMSGDVIAEHQRAYRRGVTSWLPTGAIPTDASERVRLFDERRAFVVGLPLGGLQEVPDLKDNDLLGVGLASYPTLRRAAQELVRATYRAAPRDWSKVGEAELAALDSYPKLERMAIPGAAELMAPLGWVPGTGPSEAAEETFRKLTSDWEAFENVVPEVEEEDVAGWRTLRDAWRAGKLQPTELGEALVVEVARAQRIRSELVRTEVAQAASVSLKELEGEGKAIAEKKAPVGFRAWLASIGTAEMVVAAGAMVASAVALFGPAQRPIPEGESLTAGRVPLLPPRYKALPEPEKEEEPEEQREEPEKDGEGPQSTQRDAKARIRI